MKQVQDAQEILASQTVIEQENNSLNDQIEDVSLSFTDGPKQDEKAQNEDYPFWLSWYSATMLLSLGFFLYYFPRLIGFPDATFQVTDIIATILDIIGFLIAFLLFFVAFSKIAGELITFGTLTFLCSMPIIFVMRLAVRQGRYGEVTAVFLLFFQMI